MEMERSWVFLIFLSVLRPVAWFLNGRCVCEKCDGKDQVRPSDKHTLSAQQLPLKAVYE